MEQWKTLALVICVYGVLKELRFLEPFMTQFFMTSPRNFTHHQGNIRFPRVMRRFHAGVIIQVFVQIYPASVYSQWICLVILFLVTDMVRYKPVIILNSLTGVLIYIMYSFSTSLDNMQIAYALTGLYYACELAYYTYIYAKVDREHYQEVTGYTQAAFLIGKTLSGVVAQSLVSLGVNLQFLAYISLGTMGIATFWAFSLPAADRSIYFNRSDSTNDDIGVMQVIQLLWEEIHKKDDILLNGGVDAVCTLSSAVGAYLFGKWRLDWNKYGDIAVALFSSALGNLVICMSTIPILPLSYVFYCLFFVLYNSAVTIARSQIAIHIMPDSAGLTFGATLLFALLYQSIICGVMTQLFNLNIRLQFLYFGFMYIAVGVIYAGQWLYKENLKWKLSRDIQLPTTVPATAPT